MNEQNASIGYMAFIKETTAGVSLTPTTYVPYYSQGLNTDQGLISDEPIFGYKFARLQSLPGQRKHKGPFSCMAEPNTTALIHDTIMSRGSPSGSGPYTYPFVVSNTTDPKTYTVDLSYGSYVERYFGVGSSKLGYGWDGDKMTLNGEVVGMGSFISATVASVSTTTVNFASTESNTAPTTGLVANDLVKLVKSDGTTANFTISSITDGDTVVLNATAAAFAAGDLLVLRPATPSLTILTPFLWPKTQFFFSDTAANALTASATASNQIRLDRGTELSIMHQIKEADAERSGGFDIAAIVRGDYDLDIKIKTFLGNPHKIKEWNAISKQAMLMRAYSGPTNQYELRLTINAMRSRTNDHASEKNATIFHEFDYAAEYNQSDGQAFDVKVINNLSSLG